MLAPLAQLWILVVFAIAGVVVGIAQMSSQRSCPCCHQQISRTLPKCPHCLCRMD